MLGDPVRCRDPLHRRHGRSGAPRPAVDQRARARDGKETSIRLEAVGDVVEHGHGRAARFKRGQIERDREERGSVDIDQMAGPVRRCQITRGLTASGHDLSAAIGQCQDFDGVRIHAGGGVSRDEHERFPTRQDLRFKLYLGAVIWRQDLGRTSSVWQLKQALPCGVTHEDGTVLCPARAAEDPVDGSHRHDGPSVDGDLADLVADGEANPLPVRREERQGGSLRTRQLGGRRLIEPAGEQSWRIARDEHQPHAIGRDRDARSIVEGRERRVCAQIDIEPHEWPIDRFLRTPWRPQGDTQRDDQHRRHGW